MPRLITPGAPAATVVAIVNGLLTEAERGAMHQSMVKYLEWKWLAALKRSLVYVSLASCPIIQRKAEGCRYRYKDVRTLFQFVDVLFPTPSMTPARIDAIVEALDDAVEVSPPGYEGRYWWSLDSTPGNMQALDGNDDIVSVRVKRPRGAEAESGARRAKRSKRGVSISRCLQVRRYDPKDPPNVFRY